MSKSIGKTTNCNSSISIEVKIRLYLCGRFCCDKTKTLRRRHTFSCFQQKLEEEILSKSLTTIKYITQESHNVGEVYIKYGKIQKYQRNRLRILSPKKRVYFYFFESGGCAGGYGDEIIFLFFSLLPHPLKTLLGISHIIPISLP